MRKFLKLIVHNRKAIVKTLVIGTLAVVVYAVAHEIATMMRGYEAIGGEVFLPLLVVLAEPIAKFITAPFSEVNGND